MDTKQCGCGGVGHYLCMDCGKCFKCGHVPPPEYAPKRYRYRAEPRDPRGTVKTAITFVLNKATGCAHQDEIDALFDDFYNTLNGFEAAVAHSSEEAWRM